MGIDINKVRKVFKNDNFLTGSGITIDKVDNKTALVSMKLKKMHLNEMNNPQGGAIFTLGDAAFAVNCNTESIKNVNDTEFVSKSTSIYFLNAAKGKILYAKSKILSSTYRTCVCHIDIYDELKTPVALFIGEAYRVKDIKKNKKK